LIYSYKSYPREEKLLLLSYILGENTVNPADIIGLELLPLAAGTFTVFGPATSGSVFIAEARLQRLLPTLEHRFMSNDLEETLKRKLNDSSIIGRSCLCNFSVPV
jgi:hypothetical protein